MTVWVPVIDLPVFWLRMSEISLGTEECALLQLMDKYKPHLKPYAYRQGAWLRLLEDYNEITGSVYRQTRTLRVKFNKLKALCGKNSDQTADGNLELLQKLAGETDSATRHRIRRKRRNHFPASDEDPRQDILRENEELGTAEDGCGDGPHSECDDEGVVDLDEDSSEAAQPPPLDSITMGFSLGKRSSDLNLSLGSAEPPPVGAESFSANLVRDLKLSPNNDAHIYKQLTTSLLEIILRKKYLAETPASQDSITIDTLYSELRESQRTEQQFREDVLDRLDTIIARLDNGTSLPD